METHEALYVGIVTGFFLFGALFRLGEWHRAKKAKSAKIGEMITLTHPHSSMPTEFVVAEWVWQYNAPTTVVLKERSEYEAQIKLPVMALDLIPPTKDD